MDRKECCAGGRGHGIGMDGIGPFRGWLRRRPATLLLAASVAVLIHFRYASSQKTGQGGWAGAGLAGLANISERVSLPADADDDA